MNRDEDLQGRIESLESDLAAALDRIRRLELAASLGIPFRPEPSTEPPPVLVQSTVTPEPEKPQWVAPVAPRPDGPRPFVDPSKSPPGQTVADLEYNVGTKILPWAGAIVLIVAIGVFVGNAIQRGLITPQMQFIGAVLLSLAFIGVGFKKHNEKADFGKILIAIGSCGMYLSFAGGHVFLKLFSGEMMVGLFLGWSALNLVYGSITRSTPFFMLGFFGGMSAALMPLDQDKFGTSLILQFAVLVPCLILAVQQKRTNEIKLIWFSGFVAVLSASWDSTMLAEGAVALLALGLLASLAAVLAYQETDIDRSGGFTAIPIVFSALAILVRDPSMTSTAFLVAMGVGAGLMGYVKPIEGKTNWLLAAGVGVIVMVAPIGLDRIPSYFVLISFATIAAIVSMRYKFAMPLAVSWMNFGTGTITLAAFGDNFYRHSDTLPLAATAFLGAAVGLTCLAQGDAKQDQKTIFSFLGIVLVGGLVALFFSQVGWLVQKDAIAQQIGVAYGFAVYSLVLSLLFGRQKDAGFRLLNWLTLGGVLWTYLDLVSQGNQLAFAAELPLLILGFIATAFASRDSLTMTKESYRELATYCVGVAMGVIAARILALTYLHFDSPFDKANTGALALSVLAVVFAILIYRKPRPSIATLAWTFLIMAILSTSQSSTAVAIVLFGVVTLVGWASTKLENFQNWSPGIALTINWFYFTFLVHRFIGSNVVLNDDLTTSLSWIVYGVLLLILGFWRDHRIVRLGAMAIFAVSTTKMFMVDLVKHMDFLARVGILFLLGLAMLAGGYAYLHSKAVRRPEEDAA